MSPHFRHAAGRDSGENKLTLMKLASFQRHRRYYAATIVQLKVDGSVLQLYRTLYAVRSAG